MTNLYGLNIKWVENEVFCVSVIEGKSHNQKHVTNFLVLKTHVFELSRWIYFKK